MSKTNDITDKIGKDNTEQIKNLFKKLKKTSEFEFIFFSKRDKNATLTLEKYITLLKFFTKRASIDKTKILEGNQITLDISYNPDKETSYRCTLNEKETIDKYMKKLSNANNHVILRNLVNLSSKDDKITVMKKSKNSEETIDVDDLYMRVRMADETDLTKDELSMLSKLDETTMDNIILRFKERTSLYLIKNDNSHVKIDLTITKTENRYDKLKSTIPKYELEIETMSKTVDSKLLDTMLFETEVLFKVLQQSNFIITKSEAENVIQKYKELLIVPKVNENSLYGRKPISLEIQYTEQLANKYAVTDKADGERHFLIILDNQVYLINQNLDVKNTGIILSKNQSKYNNSVVDGELIFLNNRYVFLVFDCLFNGGTDIRKNAKLEDRLVAADDIINECFVFDKQKGMKYKTQQSSKIFDLDKSLDFHKNQIKEMFNNLNHDIDIEKKLLLVRRKYFIHSLGAKPWEIYAYSSLMWNCYTNNSEIKCPYVLDGLIYQPNDQAYIVEKRNSKLSDYKWKPPEKNSIDFYIEFVKDNSGNIITLYDNSYDDVTDNNNEVETGEKRIKNQNYKICKLHVGQIIGKIQTPVLFGEKNDLYEAYLLLKDGEIRDIEGNMLSDKTVVEFYYNTAPGISNKFRWVPLRTRYDKTEAVRKHKQQYGNHISTAESVWQSINNPILMTDFDELARGNNPEKNIYFYDKKMDSLRKRIGHDLILSASKENSYFQKTSNLAKPMRAFHNFMKDNLIYTFCHSMYDNKQKSVLDIGVGKGQDNMKYYYAKVKFVVGIDIDKEALSNPLDGAISRYNKFKNKPGFPKMYYIRADFNSKLDYENQFKSLNGMDSDNKHLMEKFFSDNPSERTLFDIISAQFSIHYGFRDEETFSNLKANINNYLRNDGYLLITTFDAQKVRDFMKGKDKYTQEYTDENGNVQTLFEIIKKYQDIPDDVIMGIGNTIDVHMAWFMNEGTYQPEYLVDSRFLIEEFKKNCDLDLVTTDSFENQYNLHKDFFTNFIKYEADERTKKYFTSIQEFYKSNSINDGSLIYTGLERFYVFRKKKYSNKKQKGGDFNNQSKFYVPTMTSYDNDYSFMNSIHHILRSHQIIPQTLNPSQFYEDMGLHMKNDLSFNDDKDIKNVGKNIVIYHQDGGSNGKKEKIIDGLNIIVAERDCNDEFDVKLVKKSKKDDSNAIIIMKEGQWFVPIYAIDDNTNQKNGIFDMNDDLIKNLIDI
jgi:SAM-dependent methyltransferase